MIKLLFHRPLDTFEKTICLLSRGKYCHVAIQSDEIIYEARPKVGVRKFDVFQLNTIETAGKVIDIYNVPNLPRGHKKTITNFLERQIDKEYDYFGALGFVLYATHQGRIDWGKWICSELAVCALNKINVPPLQRCDPWKISPVILSYSPLINFDRTIIIK